MKKIITFTILLILCVGCTKVSDGTRIKLLPFQDNTQEIDTSITETQSIINNDSLKIYTKIRILYWNIQMLI